MAERRRNPLTGDWIVVSPSRLERPWQGESDAESVRSIPAHDAACHLCPGNERASGVRNPDYSGVFAFDNDFPALATTDSIADPDPLFRREPVEGVCRVLCYAGRHDVSLATLEHDALRGVVDLWCEETEVLGRDHAWVQVFENRGRMMGCSSEHPHGQAWATRVVPEVPRREDAQQRDYLSSTGSTLLLDYAERELDADERVVFVNPDWVALVPFWAAWPFETLILPRHSVASLAGLDLEHRHTLADLLGHLMPGYDRLFDTAMPYSMGWHGLPRSGDSGHWIVHAHIYPALLRSATVRKFMVGYEMLAEPQRDLTPEAAARRLRQVINA